MFAEPAQDITDATASESSASEVVRLEPLRSARRCRELSTSQQTIEGLYFPGGVLFLMILEYAGPTSVRLGLMAVAAVVLMGVWNAVKHRPDEEDGNGASQNVEEGTRQRPKRLVCRGHPYDLGFFRRPCREMFEPYIVSARSGWWDRHPGWRSLCGMVVLSVGFRVTSSVWGPVALAGAFQYAVDVGRFLWPRYYRVVPGRVEVVQYRFLNRGDPIIETVPVKGARIICDFQDQAIEIVQTGDDAECFVIPLAGLAQPRMLAQMVFRAAVCRASAPALPATELLG